MDPMISKPPPHIRRKRRPSTLPPLGLKNLGNTCYLNSVLQCLTYTPPLSQFCLSSKHTLTCQSPNCPFCILEKRISRNLTLESTPIDTPYKIHNCLPLFSEQFRVYRQEDAHEFLRYVVDACYNCGGGSGKAVGEMFGGELRSQVKCVSCGGESNKVDEIMDVSLDLFGVASVKDALGRFFQSEVLNGTNKYKCDFCKKLVVAKKQMSILKAPNVLVIQLKRFEGIHGGKIDRPIAFEECLVLSNYMCKESQDPHPEYNLFGTIVHSGYSPNSGHYYAYIKDAMGRWYCCNDSIVSLSTLQEVLSEKVYILFFIRTNQRPRSTKTTSVTNGVKPAHCNGYDVQTPKEAVPLKSVATRLDGAHNSEKVVPAISKNGDIPVSPRTKSGNLSSVYSKEFHRNGNGNGKGNGISNGEVPSSSSIKFGNLKLFGPKECNGNGINNGYMKNHIDLKEVKGMERIMQERPLVTQVNGATVNGSPKPVDPETKQKFFITNENGKSLDISVKPMKTEESENGGLDHNVGKGRRPGSGIVSQNEDSSSISGSKRKVADGEPNYSCSPDGNQPTLEKMGEMLAKDALLHLRSCGWYDDVYSFMRAKKKLCAQRDANSTNGSESKKLLMEKARPIFIRQVPASLKAHLLEGLQSFHQRRPL